MDLAKATASSRCRPAARRLTRSRALEEARRRGAATIGIANNAGTPLVTCADVGIVLATPPEMIAGSTRMGAGTAQKIALNMFSTLVAIHLGHVHDGYMVNLRADNMKLRDRAARIVSAIAGCGCEEAALWLEKAGGSVKSAILLAAGARRYGRRRTSVGWSRPEAPAGSCQTGRGEHTLSS